MANKKKRKRQRAAAAMKKNMEKGVVDKSNTGMFLYDVAAQMGDGTPIYTGMFEADDDAELIAMVCRYMSAPDEKALTVLDVHKTLPGNGGVMVVRESATWPKGVAIIRSKGMPIKPAIKTTTPLTTKKTAVVVAAVITETKVPCVPYTLSLAG